MISVEESPVNPSWMEPRIAIGPMQNKSEAVRKPRTNRLFCPFCNSKGSSFCTPSRISNHRPNLAKPFSICHHSPSRAPAINAPNTTRALVVPKNCCNAYARVNKPNPAITVLRTRSCRREPRRMPSKPPIIMAATLINVPIINRNPSPKWDCQIQLPGFPPAP